MTVNNARALTSVTIILLVWAALIFSVRIWVKTRRRTVDFWGFDDTFVSLAFVTAIVQVATTCNAINDGYGSRWSELTGQAQASVQKSLYASQILYICSMGCTRLSTCFFTGRMRRHRRNRILNHVLTAACSVTTIASVLVIAIRDTSQPWATVDGAATLYWRWIGVEVVGLAIDVCLCATSLILVWTLHMPVSKRLSVSVVFVSRLLLMPFVGVRLKHLSPESNVDRDKPNLMASIFTEACMQIAIMLATVTSLKPFLRPFHSGYLITTTDTKLSGYKTTVHGHKGSQYIQLSTAKDNSTNKQPVTFAVAGSPRNDKAQLAPPPRALITDAHGSHQSAITQQDRQNGSSDSEKMLISKTQTWTLECEDRSGGGRGPAPNPRSSSDEGHED